MAIALAVFLVIFSIFLHELGHAIYMQKYGVAIKTFSIGLPFPIKLRFSSKHFLDGATFQLTPLLLGAYVAPTEEGAGHMASLPYAQQADIYGAGPLANFLFTGALVIIMALFASQGDPGVLLHEVVLVDIALIAALFWGRTLFSRYMMLPLGVLFLGVVLWEILKAPTGAVIGPAGIVHMVGQATAYAEAISIAAILSFAIGLMNTIPLMPLDGGQTFNALINSALKKSSGIHRLRRRCRLNELKSAYHGVSIFLFIALVWLAIFSDILRLQ